MRKYYVFMNNKYVVGYYKENTIITNTNVLYQENKNTCVLLIECYTAEDTAFIKLFMQDEIDDFEVKL
ncbi:MAG: hypothetical protein KDH96_03785 [Candidatus Riesia sp.]|nr:hypothetical protein [Candidatus Riesia sp.]